MALEVLGECPICNTKSFDVYMTCEDYTTTHETFNLQQCSNCSFVFTNPRPDATSLGKYYESDKYISHTGSSSGLFDSLYLFARTFTLRQKTKLIQSYNAPGKLLDYGSGTGEFVKAAAKSGWTAYGVEPSDIAHANTNRAEHTIISKSLAEITEKKFDVITLWHVLEHVALLKGHLDRLKNLMTENGTLFVAVPNFKSADANTYREFWAAYDVPRHLWHFSQDTMKHLADNSGLRLVDIKPMKLDAYYVSLLSEKYKRRGQTIPGVITAAKNAFVSNWKARKSREYSSLIYIFKK